MYIKEFRKSRKITQVELANALGVSQASITAWERGISNPTLENILKISELYNVSVDELLTRNTVHNCKKKQATDVKYTPEISDEEREFLTTFRKLSIRDKVKVLDFMLELSEVSKGGNSSTSKIS